MKLLFKLFLASFLFFIFVLSTLGQIKKKEDTPLLPTEQIKTEVGVFIGLGGNSQSGIFITDTCKCEFDKGRGFGFTIGGLYESEIIRRLRWGGALAFDIRSFWASYRENESIEFFSEQVGRKVNVPVHFRHKAESQVFYLTFMPYLKYVPSKFIFFRFGFGGSFVLGAGLKHTKEILDETARLSTGEIVKIEYEKIGGKIATVEDGDFPAANSMQFSLEPAIGFTFPFGKKINFSPLFQYSIPLTKFSENGTDVKLSAWRIMLEFRYDITPEE
ncbi:MAG: hypothetical protein A2X61_04575 [Ignavibacteria bacterium GWB2_35_12]|nr:MAG: hypothetical protein A2X63_13370 [Ignavibacteria bacterium GWA2_35_8]OGU41905.1 MAG: hypothetical protein A2X61_04575 [Ignavibacteria bacterium GWB2_35_12]OGU87188.1 MAG: hypothetical protein A2220_07890 [Ignavibacteria bacterium RIFOXYA2_FULL_35_10]OGV24579.1 MAG: hypothetical protein A2475_09165 [Ignavibacteria bacterium RIFOXYC2_FULL_35_21]